MTRTEVLQEVRLMKFEDVYSRRTANKLTQEQAAGIERHVSCSLRWLLLETVDAGLDLGVTETMCLNVVRAAYPSVGKDRIRRELAYLEGHQLVEIERSEATDWRVTFTARGRDVFDYVSPAPDGIARPPRNAG